MEEKNHHGKNLKRFREMLGIRQDALAKEMGSTWSQKKISLLEGKAIIKPELMQELADAMKIPASILYTFNENLVLKQIQHHFQVLERERRLHNKKDRDAFLLEKWLYLVTENKKLYERIMQAEQEKEKILLDLIDRKRKLKEMNNP
jgi:transcriptional regulator with XRE-family HTH domain